MKYELYNRAGREHNWSKHVIVDESAILDKVVEAARKGHRITKSLFSGQITVIDENGAQWGATPAPWEN